MMNNKKWPPTRMKIQIFVNEKQIIKFAWPNYLMPFGIYSYLSSIYN